MSAVAVCRSSASLGLVEHAHVLDGDGALVGERLQQRDLRIREASRLAARHENGTDHVLVAKYRHAQGAAKARELRKFLQRVRRIGQDVVHLEDRAFANRSRRDRVGVDAHRVRCRGGLGSLDRHAVDCSELNHFAVEARNDAHLGVTQLFRAFADDVEYRLNVRWRARDDAQDLADCRLLIQRLLRFVEQAHVLDGDRRLLRERPHEGNLVGRE